MQKSKIEMNREKKANHTDTHTHTHTDERGTQTSTAASASVTATPGTRPEPRRLLSALMSVYVAFRGRRRLCQAGSTALLLFPFRYLRKRVTSLMHYLGSPAPSPPSRARQGGSPPRGGRGRLSPGRAADGGRPYLFLSAGVLIRSNHFCARQECQ